MKRFGTSLLLMIAAVASVYAEKANSAVDFLNSIGACVHVQHGQNAGKIAPLLRYVGIRNVRDAADRNYDMTGLLTLNRQAGVKVVIGPGSGARHEDLDATLRMARELHNAKALLAIEGPNEPNNFGGLTYKGVKGGQLLSWMPVAEFQRDLYAKIKEDPDLHSYPVFGVSEVGAQTDNVGLQYLEIPKGSDALMPAGTRFADYANIHNYMYHPSWTGAPHDNQVWDAANPLKECHADGLYGNCGKTWMKKHQGYSDEELLALPRVTTETGVRIGDCSGAITEHIQGCNYLNLFLAQYKRGWKHTFIYEFIDDPDGAFGFYASDYTTKRLSADYLHNFTQLLADNKSPKKLKSLDYSFIAQLPDTVHDLLLQKSDGHFWLIVWGEKVNGEESVTLQLPHKSKILNIYDPTKGIEPIAPTIPTTLTLSDHPILLEIKY